MNLRIKLPITNDFTRLTLGYFGLLNAEVNDLLFDDSHTPPAVSETCTDIDFTAC